MILLKNYNKLKASSLMESVIAVTVIALCLSIGMYVFDRSMNASYYGLDVESQQKVKELWLEAKLIGDFNNQEYQFEGYTIKKEVQSYQASDRGNIVYFIVKTHQIKKIYTYFAEDEKK